MYIVDVLNSATDVLFMANVEERTLDVYNIAHMSAVLEQDMIEERLVYRVNNFDYIVGKQYCKDDEQIFYEFKGNLMRVDLEKDTIDMINFGGSIQELLVIQGNSVYFKCSGRHLYFVDLDWVSEDSNSLGMTKLMYKPFMNCKAVLLNKFEFDVISNKIATFVDPFVLKVFPPLNYNFLDCIGSHEFNTTFIAETKN